MASWFDSCVNLTEIDNIEKIDTSEIKSMHWMFDTCSSLTNLDLSNFDTSNVTNMASMFSGCSGLTSLDVSNFGTTNVISVYAMFSRCSSLTSLNVSDLDTSSATDMRDMFAYCYKLTEIIGLENFDINKVETMRGMFYKDESLTSLNLSSFNTANVNNMEVMFAHAINLTTIYVGNNWDLTNVENINGMFSNCGTSQTTPSTMTIGKV